MDVFAICSEDTKMCLRGDGIAGQAESPAISLYAGMNGVGYSVINRKILAEVRNKFQHWHVR